MAEHRGQVVDALARAGAIDIEHAHDPAALDQQLCLVQITVGVTTAPALVGFRAVRRAPRGDLPLRHDGCK